MRPKVLHNRPILQQGNASFAGPRPRHLAGMEEADGAVFLGVDGQVVRVDADEPMCETVVSWALQGGGGARSVIAGSGAAAGE